MINKAVFFDPLHMAAADQTGRSLRYSALQAYSFSAVAHGAYSLNTGKIDQLGALFGFGTGGLQVTPTPFVPNYIKGLSNAGCIFGIAGTNDWRQLMFQCVASSLVPISSNPTPTNLYRVVMAFLALAEALEPHIIADLSPYDPSVPIALCGHSLGGAVALLLADKLKYLHGRNVVNVVTFGAPSPGDGFFKNHMEDLNIVQFVNEFDLVAQLPPAVMFMEEVLGSLQSFFWDSVPPSVPFQLLEQRGRIERRAGNFLSSPLVRFGLEWTTNLLTQSIGDTIVPLHLMSTYADRLRGLTQWRDRGPDLQALDAIQNELSKPGADPQAFTDPPTGWSVREGLNYVDPQNPYLDSTQTPPIVAPVSPTTLEVRQVLCEILSQRPGTLGPANDMIRGPLDYSLWGEVDPSISTAPRPNWLFKDHDRRIIETVWNGLTAIEKRDAKTWDFHPTSAISNRKQIIGWDEDGLHEAVALVKDQLATLLALERGSNDG